MSLAFQTTIYTLVGAIILFGVSEITRGFIIGPALKVREQLGLIIDKVVFFSAALTSIQTVDDKAEMISMELRAAATQLRAKMQLLPFYSFLAFFRLVPAHEDLEKVANELIRLSNLVVSIPQGTIGRDYRMRVETANEHSTRSLEAIQSALKLRISILK